MDAFLKNAFKNIFLILFFLFLGILMKFDWFFWTLFLVYLHRPFIDAATHSLNRLSEKLDNYNKNRPTQ